MYELCKIINSRFIKDLKIKHVLLINALNKNAEAKYIQERNFYCSFIDQVIVFYYIHLIYRFPENVKGLLINTTKVFYNSSIRWPRRSYDT